MGTTSKTQQTGQFNPAGMGAYNQMMPAFGQQATNFIQSPYGNPQFQFEQQLGTRNAASGNQANLSNLTRNATAMGMGGTNNPAFMEMLNNMMRGNTANTAMQGFVNPTALANQRQQSAMGLASQFRPLQTGGTSVQSTGGLGTWLPQVAGMALGAATGGMGGGGLGALFGARGGAAPSMPGGGMADPGGGLGQAMGWGGEAPGLSSNWSSMPPGGGGYGSSMFGGGTPGGGGMSPWFMGSGGGIAGNTAGGGGGMAPWMTGGYGG